MIDKLNPPENLVALFPSVKHSPVLDGFIPVLPPSTNQAYRYTPRGVLKSRKTRNFETLAKSQLLQYFDFRQEALDENKPALLWLQFRLPALTNASWPGKAKRRYKRRDTSNMIKLVEDIVADCLGVDDSCFVHVVASKCQATALAPEGVRIKVFQLS